MKMSLHHIALSVRDLEETVCWYERVLGFKQTKLVEREDLGVKVVFLEAHGMRLELFCFAQAQPLPNYRRDVDDDIRVLGTKHFALEVSDMDLLTRSLRDSGVDIGDGPQLSWNADNLYLFIHDNNGILIEFFQPLTAAEQRDSANA